MTRLTAEERWRAVPAFARRDVIERILQPFYGATDDDGVCYVDVEAMKAATAARSLLRSAARTGRKSR